MDKYALTFESAGELLEVSASTIRRLVDAGELQTVYVGPRTRRVVTESLRQWVETRAQPGYDAGEDDENEAGLAADEEGGETCPSPNQAATRKAASTTATAQARSGRSTTTPTENAAADQLARRIGIARRRF